jgi:hypothetical protein
MRKKIIALKITEPYTGVNFIHILPKFWRNTALH